MICPDCEQGMVKRVTYDQQQYPKAVNWQKCASCYGTGICRDGKKSARGMSAFSPPAGSSSIYGERAMVWGS